MKAAERIQDQYARQAIYLSVIQDTEVNFKCRLRVAHRIKVETGANLFDALYPRTPGYPEAYDRCRLWAIRLMKEGAERVNALLAIAQDPEVQSYYRLQAEKVFQSGYSIDQEGDYWRSKAKFEEAIRINPKHVSAHYYKAACLKNLQLYQDAIEFYNKTLELDPKHSGALQQRGNCYRTLGQFTEGLGDLNLSIQIAPDNLYSYYIRSLIHFSLKNYQQAQSDFFKAKPYMPTNEYFLKHEKDLEAALGHS